MEANLCFRTRHLPAMQHHKKIVVHSSVRFPALQARAGPPPGAARVAVVGAGVVLACALGTMYWKRARALPLPMSRNNTTSPVDGDGTHPDDELVMNKLPSVLSEIFINPKDSRLTEIINKSLKEEDKKKVNEGPLHNYYFGLVHTLDLISQKEFDKAEFFCNKLIKDSPANDSRPEFLLAIIKMMIAMDSMVQSPGITSKGLKEELSGVEEAWKHYLKKSESAPFQSSPPPCD